jgi:hypothetical protein
MLSFMSCKAIALLLHSQRCYLIISKNEINKYFFIFTIQQLLLFYKAVCTYGRENFESWGRKKRSIEKRAVDKGVENAMSLSR